MRKHLRVLCLSWELVTQGMIAGFGQNHGLRFPAAVSGGNRMPWTARYTSCVVLFLFLSFMQPFDEMMN